MATEKVNHTILEAKTDAEIKSLYPVLHELRPHVTSDTQLLQMVRQMIDNEGCHFMYIKDTVEGSSEAKPVSVLSYRVLHCLFYGTQMYIMDVITLVLDKSLQCTTDTFLVDSEDYSSLNQGNKDEEFEAQRKKENGSEEVDDVDDTEEGTQYGSLHTLQQYGEWAAKEETLVNLIETRLKILKKEEELMTRKIGIHIEACNYKSIKRYLEDYEESTGKALRNSHELKSSPEERGRIVASSAVLAHRMTSRYTGVVTQIRDLLSSKDYEENFQNIVEILKLKNEDKDFTWINFEDTFMSMTAFLHFEEVYWTKPEHMINGLELDTTAGGKLNPVHCASIGMFALYRKRYFMALEWMELTEQLLKVELLNLNRTHLEGDVTSDLNSAFLQLVIQESNQISFLLTKGNGDMSFRTYQNVFSGPLTKEQLPSGRVPLRQQDFDEYKGYGDDRGKSDVQFFQLCMGEKLRPVELENNLKCYYEKTKHPFLYINPVKVEVLSEDPVIYQFYEVIGNKTIELVKEKNRPLLKPSEVVGVDGIEDVSVYRTSAGIGMEFDDTPRIIYTLAEYLSGLKIWNNSEYTQFVEYTYGRFYSNHGDALENDEQVGSIVDENGDRIATMLYYLEVPELGGVTPFCQVGISPNPVRGSAILWYNLYKNGTARNDVEHGSCPVIYGHKIIMNHWIHYNGNFNIRKCSLNQFE